MAALTLVTGALLADIRGEVKMETVCKTQWVFAWDVSTGSMYTLCESQSYIQVLITVSKRSTKHNNNKNASGPQPLAQGQTVSELQATPFHSSTQVCLTQVPWMCLITHGWVDRKSLRIYSWPWLDVGGKSGCVCLPLIGPHGKCCEFWVGPS